MPKVKDAEKRKRFRDATRERNKDHLVSLSDKYTEEEKFAIRSRGGIKSRQVRREKAERERKFAEIFKSLLKLEMKPDDIKDLNPELYELLCKKRRIKGGDVEDLTMADYVSLAQMTNAFKGDNKSFENIRDTIGEKPVDKVESAFADGIKVVINDGD